MNRNTLLLIGAAALIGGGVWWSQQPKPKKAKKKKEESLEGSSAPRDWSLVIPVIFTPPKPPTPPKAVGGLGASLLPEQTRKEPVGGWEHRWNDRKTKAVMECRKDQDIVDFDGAQNCILLKVFPEARPWHLGSGNWPQWMKLAKEEVRIHLLKEANQFTDAGYSSGWPFMMWLFFDRTLPDCVKTLGPEDTTALTQCILSQAYPDLLWPPLFSGTWRDAPWDFAFNLVQKRLTQDPYGVGSISS